MRGTLLSVIALLLLTACAPAPSTPISPVPLPTAQPASAGNQAALTQLFDYSKVSAYDYRSTSYFGNQTLITHFRHTVNSEKRNDEDAWHVTVRADLESAPLPPNADAYTEYWFSKATGKCVDAITHAVVDGQDTQSKPLCQAATSLGNPTNGVTYPYIRDSNITLPLGTFAVKMYGLENIVIYFMNDKYGVPVLYTYGTGKPGPGTIYNELEMYVPS